LLVGWSCCIFDATAYVLRLVHIPSLPPCPPCNLLFVNPVKIPVLLGTRESGTREQINQSAVERPANHWRLKCLARSQKGALAFDFVLLALRASSVGNLRQVLVPPSLRHVLHDEKPPSAILLCVVLAYWPSRLCVEVWNGGCRGNRRKSRRAEPKWWLCCSPCAHDRTEPNAVGPSPPALTGQVLGGRRWR
jgi:hypothetical protein